MILKILYSILVGLAYLFGLILFLFSQPLFLFFLALLTGICYYRYKQNA